MIVSQTLNIIIYIHIHINTMYNAVYIIEILSFLVSY